MNNSPPVHNTLVAFERIVFFLCVAVIISGSFLLLGSAIDGDFFRSIFPNIHSINPRTTLAFIIGGMAVIAAGAPKYRTFLLSAGAVIFAFAFFQLYGESVSQYYGNEYSKVIFIIASIIIFVIILGNALIKINALNNAYIKTEAEAKESKARLEAANKLVTIQEEELKKNKYEVDRAKMEFVSLASHQLRTPLSTMKWHLKMLLKGDAGKLKKDQQAFIEVVDISNDKMINLVNSFLNISSMMSGKMIIDPKVTNIKELVDSLVKDVSLDLKDKDITCTVKLGRLPEIITDPILVNQVFINIIGNSIKYSPKGAKIDITAKRDADKKNIVISIKDTGYGIPEADRQKVFAKFYRSTNIQKYETEGTGLGLYIVKAIVEALGGTIWFESEEGKGTTFSFTLPIAGAKPQFDEKIGFSTL